MKNITEIDLKKLEGQPFEKRLADCVILTHDNKILLQYRPKDWHSNPDGLNLFGGHVDKGESVIEGLLRELKEEVGYGANQLHHLTALSLAPSYLEHMIDIVIVENLYPEKSYYGFRFCPSRVESCLDRTNGRYRNNKPRI